MFRLIPAPVRGALGFLAVALNTVFWCTPLYLLAFVKLLVPLPAARRVLSRWLARIAEGWIGVNNRLIDIFTRTVWEIHGLETLQRDKWYLICSNHASLVDIPVLQRVFYRRIPFIRFFIKQELIWVPILGLAWWALDFPFMKRYSRAYLAKNPHKRGADLKTTERIAQRFRHNPTAILNFAEGTRFTPAKHRSQNGPYRHLLLPKAGGIATALSTMGRQFEAILNVTIVYPDGQVDFRDLLTGRISRVIVHIEEMAIAPEWLDGNYAQDDAFRERFQQWVRDLWHEKDEFIAQIKASGTLQTRLPTDELPETQPEP